MSGGIVCCVLAVWMGERDVVQYEDSDSDSDSDSASKLQVRVENENGVNECRAELRLS